MKLYMAVFAPIPSASDSIAIAANRGFMRKVCPWGSRSRPARRGECCDERVGGEDKCGDGTGIGAHCVSWQ
jgi:hypothetical protein